MTDNIHTATPRHASPNTDLPQRVPGQSIADAYAAQMTQEQQETALKAQRLTDVHEWLMAEYARQVANVQLYKQRVYAEVLYFIETGRRPTDDVAAMAEFEQERYNTVWSVIEKAGSVQ